MELVEKRTMQSNYFTFRTHTYQQASLSLLTNAILQPFVPIKTKYVSPLYVTKNALSISFLECIFSTLGESMLCGDSGIGFMFCIVASKHLLLFASLRVASPTLWSTLFIQQKKRKMQWYNGVLP
eukprot:m.134291 g.134291  ORF g.134291 m.134291 type:complete len:125 (+) comp13954_c0_seq17:1828-2202(+)